MSTSTAIALQRQGPLASNPLQPIIQIVLDGLDSARSQRAYNRALNDFLEWSTANARQRFDKATVQAYRAELQARGLAPASINQQLSAIRKLASEAADNGLIDSTLANGISHVEGIKAHGVRSGNWLTREQAQALINAPDPDTLKGLRDRALLACLIGAGLRRSEAAALTFEHIQQRDSRWVIVDLIGKGNRVRTVPIPPWTKKAIDAWAKAAGLQAGRVFRPIHKGGFINGESMTAQAVRDVVKEYAGQIGADVAAHDLRRTFAKLAHRGGSGIDQIQLSLGHASIQTTERYLGVQQNLTDAPCDRIGLRLN